MEQIRPFTEDLVERCAHLILSVFNAEPWGDLWSEETARGMLEDLLRTPGFIGIALMDGESVVGFAVGHHEQWYNRRVFFLKEMCVRPERQGKGYGTRILRHLDKVLAAAGIKSIYLLTLGGGSAEAFYRKNGYKTSDHIVMMTRWVPSVEKEV